VLKKSISIFYQKKTIAIMHILDIQTPTMTVNYRIIIVDHPLEGLACTVKHSMHMNS
jgi:hypothetical protein